MKLPVWQVVLLCVTASLTVAQPFFKKPVPVVVAQQTAHATVKAAKAVSYPVRHLIKRKATQ
jgi:hypothetical protein